MTARHHALVMAVMAIGLLGGGCSGVAARREAAAPQVTVEARGLAQRLALMDRYRLHDEERKRMMARPRVWVEEIPEEELPAEDETEDEDRDEDKRTSLDRR